MPIKYILDPSGNIKKVDSSGDVISSSSARVASNLYTSSFKGYEETIGIPDGDFIKLGGNILPLSGALSETFNYLGGVENGSGVNILDVQRAKFKTKDDVKSLFPDSEFGTLVNGSFGFDEDSPISHYTSFNNYNISSIKSSIFADELEILAGYDFNSLGILSTKGLDLTTLAFASQFLLQSVAYLIIAKTLHNNASRSGIGNLYTFFDEFVGFRFIDSSQDLSVLILDFIRGLDAFINTDPKIPALLDSQKISGVGLLGTVFTAIGEHFTRTLLSLSKQGKNRLHMLIRKFQMQTYWHTEILYKAKTTGLGFSNLENMSGENFIDKFVVEFYRYYFKFIIERIIIGQTGSLTYESLNFVGLSEKATDAKGSSYKEFPNKFNDDYLTKVNRYHASKYRNPSINNSITTLKSIGEYYGQEFKTTKTSGNSTIETSGSIEGKIGFESGYDSDLYIHNYEEKVDKSDLSVSTLPQLIKYDYELVTSRYQDFKEYAVKGGASKNKRFSKKLRKQLEEIFNAEMTPFYFHDLRTNEMLSFHAFIDNISDSFQPQYNPISGYGRIDDVQHYTKTSRSISLSFSLYTMNEEDFATMWQQINKLVTLVYPQWSSGLPSNTGDFKKIKGFRFPFTQVPTASPLIRLKVGDLIRSNYTEYDMKKLYADPKIYRNGIKIKGSKKEQKTTITTFKNIYKVVLKSPERSSYNISFINKNKLKEIEDNVLATYEDVKKLNLNKKKKYYLNYKKAFAIKNTTFKTSSNDSFQIEKPCYFLIDIPEATVTQKNDENIITSQESYKYPVLIFPSRTTTSRSVFSLFSGRVIKSDNLQLTGKENVILDHRSVESIEKVKEFKVVVKEDPSIDLNPTDEQSDIRSKIDKVFPAMSAKKVNNPYQKAFESSEGLGLAGFITSLGIDTNNQQWETTDVDMRFDDPVSLPMGAKITIQFAPIHDIPPGIDANGVNRGEIYKDVVVEMKERESNS